MTAPTDAVAVAAAEEALAPAALLPVPVAAPFAETVNYEQAHGG